MKKDKKGITINRCADNLRRNYPTRRQPNNGIYSFSLKDVAIYFLMWSWLFALVSSTHTNILRLKRNLCAMEAPLRESQRCFATWLIFFLVTPYCLKSQRTVAGDSSRPKVSCICWQSCPRYKEGSCSIKPMTCNSWCSSRVLVSLLSASTGSTCPVCSNFVYTLWAVAVDMFKFGAILL